VDDQNCGACGNACVDGKACNGFGVCACPIGQKECAGRCIPESSPCCDVGKMFCGGVCVPSDWVGCFRSDLGSYCCPPGPMPCSSSAPSGCT
jgi:hypothetical protein